MYHLQRSMQATLATVAQPLPTRRAWITQRLARTPGVAARRWALAHAVAVLLPVTVRDDHDQLARAEQHLRAGHGLIGFLPHFSSGDVRVLAALLLQSRELRQRRVLVPVAWHQLGYPGLQRLAQLTDISIAPIVTSDTHAYEGHLHAAGRAIPWEHHAVGYGLKPYLEQAVDVVRQGGMVLLAPQGGRRSSLAPFEGRPVGALDAILRRKRVDLATVAYCFLGLAVPGLTDYSLQTAGGLNVRQRYTVTWGEVIRADCFRERATAHQCSLDDEARAIMLTLAPPAYQPVAPTGERGSQRWSPA